MIAKIFLGQITIWNDPAIAALNPGIDLPGGPITVVHRSDSSGTTYIFSDYLSSADPAWAAKVGKGKTLNWPVGEGAEGNDSVAATVFRTPFSIGYVEASYSRGLVLPFAAIRNQAGNYVTPTTQAVTAAAAQKPHITPTDFSIVNQPGATSYPITGYSWALIYTHQPSQATGQKLVTMLDWLIHPGQAYAAALGYVPLHPKSSSSLTPCSSKSPDPADSTSWVDRQARPLLCPVFLIGADPLRAGTAASLAKPSRSDARRAG